MTIRVNGETQIRNVTARLNEDGKILTIIGRNPDKTAGEIERLLSGKPKIEVMDGSAVKAIYQGMKLITISMEIIGGVLTVTASMQVDRLDMDTADALWQEISLQTEIIAEQAKTVEELGRIIDDQALVIDAQAERITAQDKSLEEMSAAVTQAQSAAQTAREEAQNATNAIAAIEEGIADA